MAATCLLSEDWSDGPNTLVLKTGKNVTLGKYGVYIDPHLNSETDYLVEVCVPLSKGSRHSSVTSKGSGKKA